VVRTVSKEMAFAPGFAMSGLEGSGMTAAASWRPTIAAAANSGATNPAQRQKTVAIAQNRQLATLHTQKQYVVTTPDAGRGNKGTSPWGFPV
jgi:hypothetical protein